MARKPTSRGRELSPEELATIRTHAESFATIEVIDRGIRALIESRWPDLAAKLPPTPQKAVVRGATRRVKMRFMLMAAIFSLAFASGLPAFAETKTPYPSGPVPVPYPNQAVAEGTKWKKGTGNTSLRNTPTKHDVGNVQMKSH
ncbi:hypothetical protein JQ543_12950 [Bradyrhizobium diazoefficiens]|nr:hypothetical protein [Bradyrhizobium diazoefficiens]MBR0848654.1 hypothetical protein [Bradyrhizobium diazoefficiens]